MSGAKVKAPDVTRTARGVTSRLLRGAATVATLPAWIVGNALMVPLLKRQLRREAAKVQSLSVERDRLRNGEEWSSDIRLRAALQACERLTDERDAARRDLQARDIEYDQAEGARREAEDLALRLAAERDEVQRKLSLANRTLAARYDILRGEARALMGEWTGNRSGPIGYVSEERIAALRAALDGTPQGQQPDDFDREFDRQVRIRPRPPVEGDHPADERTQQFASVIEHLTKQRDEDARRLQAAWEEARALKADLADWRAVRTILADWHAEGETWEQTAHIVSEQAAGKCEAKERQIATLRRELADADRDHDAAMAERQARHREVLAERDREACTALMLETREHEWRMLLSLMQSIAEKAKRGGVGT